MRHFVTLALVKIAAGTLLALDDDQVRRRRHVLTDTDLPEVFLTKADVQFKTGEVIGFVDEPPRAVQPFLEFALVFEADSLKDDTLPGGLLDDLGTEPPAGAANDGDVVEQPGDAIEQVVNDDEPAVEVMESVVDAVEPVVEADLLEDDLIEEIGTEPGEPDSESAIKKRKRK